MRVFFKPSNRKNNKLMAIFTDDNKTEIINIVHFGKKGMSDFTQHKNKQRKQNFLNRFNKLIKKNQNNPMSPMTLSNLILWNKESLEDSIEDYKKRFNLN